MSKNHRPPKWVMRYANRCKRALGVTAWDVRVTLTDDLGHEGQPAKGRHTTDWRTISSEVEFHTDIIKVGKTDEAYNTITHEFLHIAFMPHFIAFERTLDFVPEKHLQHCRDLYKDAEERIVESVARALSPVLRTVQEK